MINKYNLKENERLIVELLVKYRHLTRAELARKSGLNRSTISYITKDLESRGYINLTHEEDNRKRSGTYLTLNLKMQRLLFIDYGKRKIKLYICHLDGSLVWQNEVLLANFPKQHREEILEENIVIIKEMFPDIDECIFSIHGIVNTNNDILTSPFYKISNTYINNLFSNNKIKVSIANESNIYALGIHNPACKTSINIQINDGVGCGIIINNNLFHGFSGYSGEIGHTILHQNGALCTCGNHGCLETYISDTNTLKDLNNDSDTLISQDNFSFIFRSNELVRNTIYKKIDIISILINNLTLFFNPNTINITSNIYSNIPYISETLSSKLVSNNIFKPNINVYSFNQDTYIKGFCKYYLTQKI